MEPRKFYDELAPFYDLVFENWEASMLRQGAALDRLIREHLPLAHIGRTRVLDAACGIGTQTLPLAILGYQVTARDLSPCAIARLFTEAQTRGLSIDAAVADMREVAGSLADPYDVVIAVDNSIPHLTTDTDIRAAFRAFKSVLRPGGLCLCSVRDYAAVQRGVTATHPYGERRRGDERFNLRQDWTWEGLTHYQVAFTIDQLTPAGPVTVLRSLTRYYAVSTARLLELMAAAGFVECRRIDGALYQPVLIGRAASPGVQPVEPAGHAGPPAVGSSGRGVPVGPGRRLAG
jgi:SAM-dependent methyltransferase